MCFPFNVQFHQMHEKNYFAFKQKLLNLNATSIAYNANNMYLIKLMIVNVDYCINNNNKKRNNICDVLHE